MKITIKSNPEELRQVRLEIEIYCKANFTNIDSSKVIIAVDEALQNVIRYAYEMKPDQLIDIFSFHMHTLLHFVMLHPQLL